MRLFILFISILLLPAYEGHCQKYTRFERLPKKQKKAIQKTIKRMSIADKLLSFSCLGETFFPVKASHLGGVFYPTNFPALELNPGVPKQIPRFINLSEFKYYKDIPFPAATTRQDSGNPIPINFPVLFNTDYFVDIKENQLSAIIYGLDTAGVYAQATPYYTLDSLLSAILRHNLIYYPGEPETLISYINNFQLNSAGKKLLDVKLQAKLANNPGVKKPPPEPPNERDVRQWINQTYVKSIDTSASGGILPLQSLDSLNICSYVFDNQQFEWFTQVLSRYADLQVYNPGSSTEKDLERLSAYDLVIIPIAGIDGAKRAFIDELRSKTRVLVAILGQKLETRETQNVSKVSMPENNQLTQSILAGFIFGAYPGHTGAETLAYGLPELVGMAGDSLRKMDRLVAEAIRRQAMPGCQILVVKDGVVVWNKAYGYQTYDSLAPVTENTLYDLASITKVLATTQAVMYLVENDSLQLDEPLGNYLGYLQDTNKKNITIRQVLAHQAGLYPYYPFWKKAKDELLKNSNREQHEVQAGKSLWVSATVEDSILAWVVRSDLLAERIDTITHEQYFYSDIGFYLLKDLVEQATGQPFDQFLARQFYRPLGTSLVFNPTCYYPVDEIAPTEIDNQLRHELVQGFVHDRNAALMGGVGGQAGLFGNANDIAILLQMQLNGGHYGGRQYFHPATIKQFISRQFVNNRRGLGWDKPGPEPDGPVSKLATDETFGHSGFTGGSIWVDPKESLIFVFLSNRVYPSVENTKLIDMNIRTRIQDIVYRSIIK
jgi:beta-N-acetylhexosaminidase